jgi:hypothetical protein
MPRRLMIVALVPLLVAGFGATATAKKKTAPVQSEEAPPAEAESPPAEAESPPAESPAPPAEAAVAAAADALMSEEAPPPMAPVDAPHFGGAFRSRWVSVPHWVLSSFTQASQSVSSYSVAIEAYRRKRDEDNPNRFWEVSLAVGYQSMSAPDGNWLGKNRNPAVDTDWVQFKNNFGFWTIDLSFIQRQFFNDVFGIHYGAGWGLAIIQGEILRTKSYGPWDPSANNGTGGFDIPCNYQNVSQCRPIKCTGGVCTEGELAGTEANGQKGTASDPHRYRETSVPGAILIVNLLAGFDFRIPSVKGLELRLEGGFYDALFLGGAAAYTY